MSGSDHRARDGAASWLLPILVGLPVLVLVVQAARSDWRAVNVDYAAILVRTWEVGSGDSPLVGAYSRFGWSHPGPMLFWVAAPLVRLLGPPGLLVTAGLVNAAAGAGAVVAAARTGGVAFAAPTAAAAAVMMHALTAAGLLDPWNPYVAVVPFLAYLVCLWGAANGDRFLLVAAVAAGSWCVQAHLSYLPVALAATGLAVVWRLVDRPHSEARIPLPWLAGVAATGLILWLPPLIDQVTSAEGNLSSLYRFAADGSNPADLSADPVGWTPAVGAAGGLFDVGAQWTETADADGYLRTPAGSVAIMLVVLALFAAVGALAWVRGDRQAAGLVAVAVVLVPVSILAMARTADDLFGYLLRWTWAVAALGWIAALWALLTVLGPRAREIAAGLSCVAVTAFGVVTLADDSMDGLVRRPSIGAVEQISEQLLGNLDRDVTYSLTVVESDWYYMVTPGVAAQLIVHGQPVVVHEGLRNMFTEAWIAERGRKYPEVTILPKRAVTEWRATNPEARRVAVYDPRRGRTFDEAHEAWLRSP